MKKVCILVPEMAVIEAVADPRYLFQTVNQFHVAAGQPPLFDERLVATCAEVALDHNVFTVRADALLEEVATCDLVVIPALSGDLRTAISLNAQALPWIRQQYAQGAEIAALCLGAFLLASTGLLDGKKCSTHWGFANEFRQLFPAVTLVDGLIVTEEQRLYTSGGANSYWNLLLYLVEKYSDRDTAILAAKYFAIDIDRDSQAAFALFQGQKGHEDGDILKVQDYLEANYQQRISVEQLADRFGIGRRNFERRFKKATHNTVLEYHQRLRVEAAKRRFESTRQNIHEVMSEVG
jgi:transcriptional regulator GlxA family with amidase domain